MYVIYIIVHIHHLLMKVKSKIWFTIERKRKKKHIRVMSVRIFFRQKIKSVSTIVQCCICLDLKFKIVNL